jgi:D-serine deaminase-like pyridoxal phosphate-dependent protein
LNFELKLLPHIQAMPTIADLDTPALCIDLDAFEANVKDLVSACQRHGISWRPHAKCHKSVDVARRLIEAGAIGLTCAKLGEAEVYAAAGIRDLLVANLLVGPQKVQRLVALRRTADPIVCFDNLAQAEPIGRAMNQAGLRVRALLEIDIGMQRAGVQPGEPALALASAVAKIPGIDLAGIMGYEGHLLLLEDPVEKEAKIRAALTQLTQTRDLLVKHGIACPMVSCGGTGSFATCVSQPGITEIQCGGAIFMDAFYRFNCHVAQFRYALKVIATVVSRPAPDQAIIDAGRKTMNMELAKPFVLGRDDVHVVSLSAEHGILRLDPTAQDVTIGQRLEIVPGYSDFTCVLHDRYYALRGNEVEAIWPLAARGKLA